MGIAWNVHYFDELINSTYFSYVYSHIQAFGVFAYPVFVRSYVLIMVKIVSIRSNSHMQV